MTTILLIRHAVNDYVKTGKLAGWTPGVHLNEDGVAPIDFRVASRGSGRLRPRGILSPVGVSSRRW